MFFLPYQYFGLLSKIPNHILPQLLKSRALCLIFHPPKLIINSVQKSSQKSKMKQVGLLKSSKISTTLSQKSTILTRW